ncbi:hypothetical protein ACFL0M_13805 [Thermodesulfobacteriota bacterium]
MSTLVQAMAITLNVAGKGSNSSDVSAQESSAIKNGAAQVSQKMPEDVYRESGFRDLRARFEDLWPQGVSRPGRPDG